MSWRVDYKSVPAHKRWFSLARLKTRKAAESYVRDTRRIYPFLYRIVRVA